MLSNVNNRTVFFYTLCTLESRTMFAIQNMPRGTKRKQMKTIEISYVTKEFAGYGHYIIRVYLTDGRVYSGKTDNMRVIDNWDDQETRLDAASVILTKAGVEHDGVKFA